MTNTRMIRIHGGGVDFSANFNKDDLNSFVQVFLSDGIVPINLSGYTDLSLRVCFVHHEYIKHQLDLDHPFLPRTYNRLILEECRLIGSYTKPIRVKSELVIRRLFANDKFRSYVTCDNVCNVNSCSLGEDYKLDPLGYRNTGQYIPPGIRCLIVSQLVPLYQFKSHLKEYPNLHAASVVVKCLNEVDDLWKTVKREIHRLKPCMIRLISTRGWIHENINPDLVKKKLIENIQCVMYKYQMMKIFYEMNKRYRGLGMSLVAVIRLGYVIECPLHDSLY